MTAIVTIRRKPPRGFWKWLFFRCPPPEVTAHVKQEFGIQYLCVTCEMDEKQEIPWENLRRAAVGADSALLPEGLNPAPAFDLPQPACRPFEEACMRYLFLKAVQNRQGRRNRILLCDPDARMLDLCRDVMPYGGTVRVYTKTAACYEPLQWEMLQEWGAPLVVTEQLPEEGTDTLLASLEPEHFPVYHASNAWLFTVGRPSHPVEYPERMICSYRTTAPLELTQRFPGYASQRLAEIFAQGTLRDKIFDIHQISCITADGGMWFFPDVFGMDKKQPLT